MKKNDSGNLNSDDHKNPAQENTKTQLDREIFGEILKDQQTVSPKMKYDAPHDIDSPDNTGRFDLDYLIKSR